MRPSFFVLAAKNSVIAAVREGGRHDDGDAGKGRRGRFDKIFLHRAVHLRAAGLA